MRLSVTETGTEMSREDLERAFRPVLHDEASREGDGLGVSTVYGIVKQAGGTVTRYSEQDPPAGSRRHPEAPRDRAPC